MHGGTVNKFDFSFINS